MGTVGARIGHEMFEGVAWQRALAALIHRLAELTSPQIAYAEARSVWQDNFPAEVSAS